MRNLLMIFVACTLINCSGKYERVSMDRFIGTWELHGRKMFKGIQINIAREKGKLVGKIQNLNENKYVQMLAVVGDTWVSGISRSSNYQFRLTEKKIGAELFSLYGLDTSNELRAEFIDDNTIGLATGSADPTESSVIYKRID
ncbi:MAG: hypothetical protein WD555_03005 [Fulvivirga sp.]